MRPLCWAAAATGLAGLGEELNAIRNQGYRVEPSSYLVGVTDISVPVPGCCGEAIAVLTCAYMEHPADTGSRTRDRALELLRELAARL